MCCILAPIIFVPIYLSIIEKNSIDGLINELQNKKIVMIGETHVLTNEELFIAANLKKLHEAGVRYFFIEGGSTLETAMPGSLEYFFLMFYPWSSAGWRYEAILLYKAVMELNDSLPINERIKFISPEPYIDINDQPPQILNYRDSHSAKNIINIMDNENPNEKAIMLFGGGHAHNSIIKNNDDGNSEIYDWIPLGFRLKEYYGSDFSSFNFFLLNTNLLNKSIFMPIKTSSFDGYIIEREMYGTFYQYNPTNENLKFIFELVKNYPLDNDNIVPNATHFQFDEQGQFLTGLYYLKLYFGDKFDYSFWRTGQTKDILASLDELEQYAFSGNNPSDFVSVRHTYDNILLYHDYMYQSRINSFIYYNGTINEKQLVKAWDIFPEDLWGLYWLAFWAIEKRQYNKAIKYFQTLFANELSLCMEILPLAYRKAELCAEKLGDKMLQEEYKRMADNLFNEYRINVEGNFYTGY
jgi:hypothetical protein